MILLIIAIALILIGIALFLANSTESSGVFVVLFGVVALVFTFVNSNKVVYTKVDKSQVHIMTTSMGLALQYDTFSTVDITDQYNINKVNTNSYLYIRKEYNVWGSRVLKELVVDKEQ